MSLKKLISHTVIIGSLLIATPVGAVSKHISSPVKAGDKISHVISKHKWYEPLLALPSRSTVVCILKAESTSTMLHPNLGDNNNKYQYGPFQFTTILWNRWSWVAGVGKKMTSWYLGTLSLDHAVTIPAYKSTLYQQAKVFATVVRNDGYGMWTRFDNC